MGDRLYDCGKQENLSEFLRKYYGKCAFVNLTHHPIQALFLLVMEPRTLDGIL
jgi:hypothetical protein